MAHFMYAIVPGYKSNPRSINPGYAPGVPKGKKFSWVAIYGLFCNTIQFVYKWPNV